MAETPLAERLREVAVIAVRSKRSRTQHEMADAAVAAVLRELADEYAPFRAEDGRMSYPVIGSGTLIELADSIEKGGQDNGQ